MSIAAINAITADKKLLAKLRSSHRIRGHSGEPLSRPPYGYIKSPENPKKWMEAAAVVKDIFKMYLEGKGTDTILEL